MFAFLFTLLALDFASIALEASFGPLCCLGGLDAFWGAPPIKIGPILLAQDFDRAIIQWKNYRNKTSGKMIRPHLQNEVWYHESNHVPSYVLVA
jgi:hypothetical protein